MEKLNGGSHYLTLQRVTLAGVLLLIGATAQADYYKWTDAEGQVHYSQHPPAEVSPELIEQVEVRTRAEPSPPLQVPEEGAQQGSCGSLALPKPLPNPVARIVQLRQTLTGWQKYLDEHSGSSDEGVVKRLEELRCAIDFANRELQTLSDVEENLQSNYEDTREELEKLQQELKECDKIQDDEIGAAECRGEHRERITQLEKMLRTLESERKLLQQPE